MGSSDLPGFAASCHETHIAVVFLFGDQAFKVKKPVRTGFLDFTTQEARLRACQRELELNRRFAPDVYLGVSDVSDPITGQPMEHLLVMRRMPADRRLSALIRAGEPVTEPLRALAKLLAAFHARADRGPAISAAGTVAATRQRWRDTLGRLARFRGGLLDDKLAAALLTWPFRFLDGRGPLFESRIRAGKPVDGHGDLVADDVFCLPDGPRALDCLEFDDKLRYVDGLDDAAFLAMDLERLGRPDLAEGFLTDYAAFAGDPAPTSLRHHYIAYRACVRTLVNCLKAEQGDPEARELVDAHARISVAHLKDGAVRLALVGGLPATGKSTLASALADAVGAVLLSSDRLRKEQAGMEPEQSAAAPYRQGLYAPSSTDLVYSELIRRAERALAQGEHVVLDASWTSAEHRAWASVLADQACAELVPLRCAVPHSVTTERLLHRRGGASDATLTIATEMARDADPWPEAITVSTTKSVDESLADALDAWRGICD